MTDPLVNEPFTSHSGIPLSFKIDADALTDADLATIANVVSKRLTFDHIHFVPRGGARLARALANFAAPGGAFTLIVDDVLTTGNSMEKIRTLVKRDYPAAAIFGIVLFARGPCPFWIKPFFTLHETWR